MGVCHEPFPRCESGIRGHVTADELRATEYAYLDEGPVRELLAGAPFHTATEALLTLALTHRDHLLADNSACDRHCITGNHAGDQAHGPYVRNVPHRALFVCLAA